MTILNRYDFISPKIKTGKYNSVEVTEKKPGVFRLTVNDHQWMAYDVNTNAEGCEFFSHYFFARGDVVVTGMGFGVREDWILAKKEVTSLTIIEKHEDVIDYHKQINSNFLQKTRVIHADARDVDIDCDVLLLDHYELPAENDTLEDVKYIHDRAKCDIFWFWPLELFINKRYRKQRSSRRSKFEIYNDIRETHNLGKLPLLDEKTLNMFCFMFSSRGFS